MDHGFQGENIAPTSRHTRQLKKKRFYAGPSCTRRIATKMQINETSLLNGASLSAPLLHLEMGGRTNAADMDRPPDSQRMIDT